MSEQSIGALDLTVAGFLPLRLDDFAGLGTYRGKPIFTLPQIDHQLDTGLSLTGRTITYGFLDTPVATGIFNSPQFPYPDGETVSPFTETQRAAARAAIHAWDDLIPQSFVEKNGAGADIILANSTSLFTGGAAETYYPDQNLSFVRGFNAQVRFYNATGYHSDVFVDGSFWANYTLDLNSIGFGRQALVHELGHSLGLSHPGAYNVSPGATLSYDNNAEYAQDSRQFTTMSYFQGFETEAFVADPKTLFFTSPQTPLVHDIHVIQQKYGADPTTRAGDTVYGFHSNAGQDVYDFGHNPIPYLCIYDAGGADTLDLSGMNSGVFIDLRPGSFSSAAMRPTLADANAAIAALNAIAPDEVDELPYGSQAELDGVLGFFADVCSRSIEDYTGVAGVQALAFENISIAYNTIIENGVGGDFRDYLVGNAVGNHLSGAGGDDVLNGLGGADTLSGGDGADEFRFTELGATDRITDFVEGVDALNLSEIDADSGVAGDQAFTVVAAFTHAAGQAVLSYSGQADTTKVSLDVNSDGVSDMDILMNGHVTNTGNWIL